MPPEQEQRDAAAYQFVAALGGAVAAANYPVTMRRPQHRRVHRHADRRAMHD